MKKIILTAISLLMSWTTMTAQDDNTQRLWYDKPASIWLEALPVGNGRLGGMVLVGWTTQQQQFVCGKLFGAGTRPHLQRQGAGC